MGSSSSYRLSAKFSSNNAANKKSKGKQHLGFFVDKRWGNLSTTTPISGHLCFQKLRKLVNNCASGCTKPQDGPRRKRFYEARQMNGRKKDAAPRGTASEREDESGGPRFHAPTAARTKQEQRKVAGQTAAKQALRTRGKRAHRKEARCRTKGISLFRAGRSPFPTRTLRSGCKTYTPRLSSFPVRSKTPTHALRACAA